MPDKIIFYRDKDKGILNPVLFADTAENWAREVHDKGGRNANKRSQIRKFYDEVLRLNGIVKGSPGDWDHVLPFVNMLIAKAVYARGRNKITDEFVVLLKECTRQVSSPKDLDVFTNFFEAFMGYYRQYGEN